MGDKVPYLHLLVISLFFMLFAGSLQAFDIPELVTKADSRDNDLLLPFFTQDDFTQRIRAAEALTAREDPDINTICIKLLTNKNGNRDEKEHLLRIILSGINRKPEKDRSRWIKENTDAMNVFIRKFAAFKTDMLRMEILRTTNFLPDNSASFLLLEAGEYIVLMMHKQDGAINENQVALIVSFLDAGREKPFPELIWYCREIVSFSKHKVLVRKARRLAARADRL